MAVCKAAPEVDVAIVIVRDDLPGGDALVAYVKLAADANASAMNEQAVKAAMRASIPAYMVPKHFVLVGSFPMTPNLKVDRKQLPVPPAAAAAAPPATVAAAAAAAEAKVSADPAAPERQQKAPKKRGFWRSLGHALATPYREIAEASERIAAAEARDAAVQRVEEAVAALAGLDTAAGIDAASRRRIEAAAAQALAAVGSKKVVTTKGAAAVQRPAGAAPAAAPAATPVAADD